MVAGLDEAVGDHRDVVTANQPGGPRADHSSVEHKQKARSALTKAATVLLVFQRWTQRGYLSTSATAPRRPTESASRRARSQGLEESCTLIG